MSADNREDSSNADFKSSSTRGKYTNMVCSSSFIIYNKQIQMKVFNLNIIYYYKQKNWNLATLRQQNLQQQITKKVLIFSISYNNNCRMTRTLALYDSQQRW